MSFQDREYFRLRAIDERQRAATASSVAAAIHLELACLYEKLVELERSEQPSLAIVPDRLSA
jgi:hypothetical protein